MQVTLVACHVVAVILKYIDLGCVLDSVIDQRQIDIFK